MLCYRWWLTTGLFLAWDWVLARQIPTSLIVLFFANKSLLFWQYIWLRGARAVSCRLIRSHASLCERKRSFFHKLGKVQSTWGNGGYHSWIKIAPLALYFIPCQIKFRPTRVGDQLESVQIYYLWLFLIWLDLRLLPFATSTLSAWLSLRIGVHLITSI